MADIHVEVWRSLVARTVRDREVASSSLVTSTKKQTAMPIKIDIAVCSFTVQGAWTRMGEKGQRV